MKQTMNPQVAAVFDTYPAKIRNRLLALRALILETAASTDGVGVLTETLKWGEPAYLTTQSKSGTTIRLGWKAAMPDEYAMYFHCQTNLVESFREWFPNDFEFQGNRSIIFRGDEPISTTEALACCISAALTYHLNKGASRV